MSTFGWKDVLRPIRDGYNHLFPTPGPTPEERRKQRELDRLKGFTYFDAFEEILNWTVQDSDPIQRSNTPLLSRPRAAVDSQRNLRSKLLLVHDYAGGYHDYESSLSVGIGQEFYACEYLQYVDSFVYFSHKLASVPPPSWTNTLHRNGVKVLGTFLVEPQTPSIERILDNNDNPGREGHRTFPLATQLTKIADYYGFDGWLINIEKPFPPQHWSQVHLMDFLAQLKDELGPKRKLIWYDALTSTNKVEYQNTLNSKNGDFARQCGSILTNYSWKEGYLSDAIRHAKEIGIATQDVYFGIDVWAQNKSSFTQPRRVTYPEKNGGGTNTGIAVEELGKGGLASGVFAPAWTFEHFPEGGRAVERSLWVGAPLPDNLNCSCGDTCGRHPAAYCTLAGEAAEHPAGSENFFYTDFQRAFGPHSQTLDHFHQGHSRHAQLGSQSVLPNLHRLQLQDQRWQKGYFNAKIEENPFQNRLTIDVLAKRWSLSWLQWRLPILWFDMPGNGSLELSIKYRYQASDAPIMTWIYLGYNSGIFSDHPLHHGTESQTMKVRVEGVDPDGNRRHQWRLREVGARMKPTKALAGGAVFRLIDITEICILPVAAPDISCDITGIGLKKRAPGENPQWRLYWSFTDTSKEQVKEANLPYSDVTGPFSYFKITVDEEFIGRAYSTEFILPDALVPQFERSEGAMVRVVGVGFYGTQLAELSMQLHLAA